MAMHSPTLIVGFFACSGAGYRYKEIIPSHTYYIYIYIYTSVIMYLICIHLSFLVTPATGGWLHLSFPIFINFFYSLQSFVFSPHIHSSVLPPQAPQAPPRPPPPPPHHHHHHHHHHSFWYYTDIYKSDMGQVLKHLCL